MWVADCHLVSKHQRLVRKRELLGPKQTEKRGGPRAGPLQAEATGRSRVQASRCAVPVTGPCSATEWLLAAHIPVDPKCSHSADNWAGVCSVFAALQRDS